MFGLPKKKAATPPAPSVPASTAIRDTLFGDKLLDQWPAMNAPVPVGEPWASFVRARNAIGAGQKPEAAEIWREITEMPGLESRHYAQAWCFLRVLGISPPEDRAKQMLGVVVEVAINGGVDLVAAYPERNARYYNFSGAAVVWEHPDDSLDAPIDKLLAAGDRILQQIGPWKGARPAAPPQGQVRVNCIAPTGIHFGQGPFADFSADPLAKPAIEAAAGLMDQLIAKTAKK